uniref:Uncharacterized protein n=1 Tax=Meloidogyne floridensis TaxID=298350 RepID=A0A915NTY5_9BILA
MLSKLCYLFLLFTSLFCDVYAEVDCSKGFEKEARSTCEQMVAADKAPPITQVGPPIDGGGPMMEDRDELNCLNLSYGTVNGCTLPNGKKLKKCIRQELRMLSDEQRQAYFKAVQQMKDNGAYNLCAIQHKDAYLLKGAH